MAYYGDIEVESRLKIQALEIKFLQEIKELANELPDVSARDIQQMVFEDMRIERPIVRRGPSHYNSYVSTESKNCGGMENATKKYSQLPESEKLAIKEARNKNPTPAQQIRLKEKNTSSPYDSYSEKLKKLTDKMYSEADCHVVCYVSRRRMTGTNPSAANCYAVYGTEIARQYSIVEAEFLGVRGEQAFRNFVLNNDNGIVRENTPRIRRTKVPGTTNTSGNLLQKIQAKNRSEFVKLVLSTLKKGNPDRLQDLRTVPWKRLRQTRRCYGLRLAGWPEHIPIDSALNPEDQKMIITLIDEEKIMFV